MFRYREHLKEWEARGWRIDMKALRAKQGDVAFAVPCPGRRESGNWVLDTVPLVPVSAASTAESRHSFCLNQRFVVVRSRRKMLDATRRLFGKCRIYLPEKG